MFKFHIIATVNGTDVIGRGYYVYGNAYAEMLDLQIAADKNALPIRYRVEKR